jgi:WD40 repeat protein
MGEVWRAFDPRLGRDVAVKVLPAPAGQDPARLRRFEQEALAAGALNHPNLLAVFDAGEHEGAPYLVFERLEGKTLRERLAEGPIPARRAAGWAAQVARGLAAAHDKSIVHRDLKPENLFVLADGRVKVLDFGLAKLAPTASPIDDSQAETESRLTQPGTIVGTVAYMSPEQVRAAGVDARTDIFSLGVVLHEMLSGRRPFARETPAETMAAILKEEPPDIAASGATVPPVLDLIVRRCLEKDPAARFRSAHDLAFALEAVGGGSDAAAAPGPNAARGRSGRRPWRWVLLGATLAVAVGAAAFFAGRRSARFDPPTFERVTFRRGSITWARFAADGDTIVYGAAWEGRPPDVYMTRRGSAESRPLGFSPAILLALSSTGEMALSLEPRFVLSNFQPGVLAQAPLTGGAARRLVPAVNAADWSPDGRSLALARSWGDGTRIEYPQGKVVYETKDATIGSLRVSPDGTRLAFTEHAEGTRVMVLEPDGRARALSSGWEPIFPGLAWSPSGREVYFSLAPPGSRPNLYAVDLGGRLRRLLQLPGDLRLQDVARDGTFLLSHVRFALRLMVAHDSRPDEDLTWFNASFVLDTSPDGRQLLFFEQGKGSAGGEVLYMRTADGAPAVRLSSDSTFRGAALSPDGTRVLAVTADRLVVLRTGEGDTVALPSGPIRTYYGSTWMPDGRHVLITGRDAEGSRVFLQDTQGDPPRPVTPVGFVDPQPLPDGRGFVTLRDRIFTHALDGTLPQPGPVVHPGRTLIRCAADGRSVFAYAQGELPGHLYRIDLATGREEVVRTLMPPDPAAVWRIHPVVVTPDGRTVAYGATQTFSDLYLYRGLR